MIKYVKGNLLNSDANFIVHQVNCFGPMGGLAAQIIEWEPSHYQDYITMCKMFNTDTNRRKLMGEMVLTEYDTNKYICGIFGQYESSNGEVLTEYIYVARALLNLVALINEKGYKECRIAIPYKMSCGLAGGDWNTILSILINIFDREYRNDECDITLEIWEYNGDPVK